MYFNMLDIWQTVSDNQTITGVEDWGGGSESPPPPQIWTKICQLYKCANNVNTEFNIVLEFTLEGLIFKKFPGAMGAHRGSGLSVLHTPPPHGNMMGDRFSSMVVTWY